MKEKLQELLNQKQYEEVAKLLEEYEVVEVYEFLKSLKENDFKLVCANLNSDMLAQIFKDLDNEELQKYMNILYTDKLDEVMEELSVEETVEIIKDIPHDYALKIAEEEEILELLNKKDYQVLKPLLANMMAIDVANILNNLNGAELVKVFRILPKDLAAEVFVEMAVDKQETLLIELNNKEISNVIEELFLDDVVDIIEEMPTNVVKRMLAQSDNETRKYINDLLKYPEDSAGSIMTIEYIKLKKHFSVKQALESIRKNAIDKETIYTCYVVDDTNRLIGVVTVKDLFIHNNDEIISDFMNKNVIFSRTTDDKEEVAKTISKYGFLAIPIVDTEDRLVGIVTVDDAIDVLEQETTEDISKMNAMLPSDKEYLDMSVFEIWKKRIPWLLILLISATFTGLIISSFEEQLSVISPLLFACVPMMMDTGGNAGSQASVTIIRGISLNQLGVKDYGKIIFKEIRSAIFLGITLSMVCFVKLLLIDKLLFGQAYTLMICLVVSIALFATVIVAKIVGATLPLLAKLVKLDPAVVASPFITTIVDAVALIVYCYLAISILA